MMIPRINHSLTAEDTIAASAAVTALEDLFEFCIALEPRDRSTLFKLGPNTESFVTRILELSQIHIDLIPRGTDVANIVARQTTRLALRNQHARLQPLVQRLDNTVMLLGADVLRDCLALYKILQVHGKTAGLEALLADIGRRFAKNRRSGAENPAQPQGEGTVTSDTVPTV